MLSQVHPSPFFFNFSFLKQLFFHTNFIISLAVSMKYPVGILIWNSPAFELKSRSVDIILRSADILTTLDLCFQGHDES